MHGLINKTTNLEEQFINPDGSPKPGTKGFAYLQNLVAQINNQAYCDGVKFALNDITNRLRPLITMKYEELPQNGLPSYAKELESLISCLLIYSQGLNSQINNLNKTNFREGSRKLVLRAEKLLDMPRGSLLNELLTVNVSKITETRGAKSKNNKLNNKKEEKLKKIEEQTVYSIDEEEFDEEIDEDFEIDPADLIKNEEITINED